jgi:hypothetical protein
MDILQLPLLRRCTLVNTPHLNSESESYVTTDGQSANLSWNVGTSRFTTLWAFEACYRDSFVI